MSETDPVVVKLHARLDEQPNDWNTRLVLADRYEELGDDDRARFQRWTVRNKRRPGLCQQDVLGPISTYSTGWAYFRSTTREALVEVCLGAELWIQLLLGPKLISYSTRREAEDRLADKLKAHGYPDVLYSLVRPAPGTARPP